MSNPGHPQPPYPTPYHAPPPVNDWVRARSGLSLMFWAALVLVAVDLLQRIAGTLLFELLRGQYMETRLEVFGTVTLVLGLGNVTALILFIVALARFAGCRSISGLGGPALVAMILQCVHAAWLLLIVVANAYDNFSRGSSFLTYDMWRIVSSIGLLVAAAAIVVTVVSLLAIGRAARAPLPIWILVALFVLLAWDTLFPIYRYFLERDVVPRKEWIWFLSGLLTNIGIGAMFLLLVAGATRAANAMIEPVTQQAPGGWGPSPAWFPAARGLALYRTAVIVRILVLVVGGALLLLAILTRTAPLAVILAFGMPLATLVAGILMIVGLVGYASVPRESGASELAAVSLALHAIALLIEIVGVAMVFIAIRKAGSASHLEDAGFSLRKLQLIEMAGQVLGLGALLVLVASLKRVASFVGARLVAARATPVIALVSVTVVAAFVYRLLASNPRAGGMGILVIGIGVLFLAITALVMYLGFVGRVRALMVEGHHGDPSPDAW